MNECEKFLSQLSKEDLEHLMHSMRNPAPPKEKLIEGFRQYYESK